MGYDDGLYHHPTQPPPQVFWTVGRPAGVVKWREYVGMGFLESSSEARSQDKAANRLSDSSNVFRFSGHFFCEEAKKVGVVGPEVLGGEVISLLVGIEMSRHYVLS